MSASYDGNVNTSLQANKTKLRIQRQDLQISVSISKAVCPKHNSEQEQAVER